MEEEFVICVSCKEEVKVKPVKYGDGCIATCPKCGKIALNRDKKEK